MAQEMSIFLFWMLTETYIPPRAGKVWPSQPPSHAPSLDSGRITGGPYTSTGMSASEGRAIIGNDKGRTVCNEPTERVQPDAVAAS